nr:type II toxin-antitoxin system RelE/ParE family toxin [Rhizobium paranaense]
MRYTRDAQNDILNILTFIAHESGSQKIALKFTTALRGKCSDLASLPGHMGRPRPELRHDIRSYAFRGYVIFFHYVGDVFEVLKVLEGHRDLDSHFHHDD